ILRLKKSQCDSYIRLFARKVKKKMQARLFSRANSSFKRGSSRDQTASNGAQHKLRGAVHVHFLHDAHAMRLHRMQTETEVLRDFLVAASFRQKLVDLALAQREQLVTILHIVR